MDMQHTNFYSGRHDDRDVTKAVADIGSASVSRQDWREIVGSFAANLLKRAQLELDIVLFHEKDCIISNGRKLSSTHTSRLNIFVSDIWQELASKSCHLASHPPSTCCGPIRNNIGSRTKDLSSHFPDVPAKNLFSYE